LDFIVITLLKFARKFECACYAIFNMSTSVQRVNWGN
jgi:hypothetical protein